MSSAIPNTFGISLKISSILCWNMLPAGTAPNSRCLYLYLPNGQANVVRYNDCISSLRLWYPELTSIMNMYCTLFSLGSISFSVGPLCIGLINAWLGCTGSRHGWTNYHFTVCFGYQHKAITPFCHVLSTPRGVMMSIPCRHSSSSLAMVFVVHMLHALVVLGMACCQA